MYFVDMLMEGDMSRVKKCVLKKLRKENNLFKYIN